MVSNNNMMLIISIITTYNNVIKVNIIYFLGNELTNNGLSNLSSLVYIEELDISYNDDITSEGLLIISSLNSIISLTLSGNQLSDIGLTHIFQNMNNLKQLHLGTKEYSNYFFNGIYVDDELYNDSRLAARYWR